MLIRDLHPEDIEPVTFTDAEWRRMMSDPVYYGYACRSGHLAREDDLYVIANGCPTCERIGEAYADLYEYATDNTPTHKEVKALDRWAKSLEVWPVIRCGNCKGSHVGVGGVRRCYDGGKWSPSLS